MIEQSADHLATGEQAWYGIAGPILDPCVRIDVDAAEREGHAGVFILLLGTLSHFMTLEYPEGILRSDVTLPWPLQ